jgi:hypothetical protein
LRCRRVCSSVVAGRGDIGREIVLPRHPVGAADAGKPKHGRSRAVGPAKGEDILEARGQSSRRSDLRTTGSPQPQIFLEPNAAPPKPAVDGTEALDAALVGLHFGQRCQNCRALVIAQALGAVQQRPVSAQPGGHVLDPFRSRRLLVFFRWRRNLGAAGQIGRRQQNGDRNASTKHSLRLKRDRVFRMNHVQSCNVHLKKRAWRGLSPVWS